MRLVFKLLFLMLTVSGIVYAQQHIGGQLNEAALENRTGDPSSGNIEGRIYFDTDDDVVKVYDGASYLELGDTTGFGSGDVVGPASATDEAIALYNGTTGKAIKNSSLTVSGDILSGLGTASGSTDATNKAYVDAADALKVTGLGSATDNALVKFDGTDGKTIQQVGFSEDAGGTLVGSKSVSQDGYLFGAQNPGLGGQIAFFHNTAATGAGVVGSTMASGFDGINVGGAGVFGIAGTSATGLDVNEVAAVQAWAFNGLGTSQATGLYAQSDEGYPIVAAHGSAVNTRPALLLRNLSSRANTLPMLQILDGGTQNQALTINSRGDISSIDDDTNNTAKTMQVTLKSGDRTVGNARSGDVTIETGTSAVSTRGDVYLSGNDVFLQADTDTPVAGQVLTAKSASGDIEWSVLQMAVESSAPTCGASERGQMVYADSDNVPCHCDGGGTWKKFSDNTACTF